MPENVEEQSLGLDLERYLGLVRRRHLNFLSALLLGWSLVWGASWVLPPHYKSATLILVEQPTMPRDYVTPNISDNLQERLQTITQQILSRTNLLQIITALNLYNSDGKAGPDNQVERMRKDIEIELVRGGGGQVTAFNIYYSARDAHVAQQVTSQLSNLFINKNLEVRQHQSEDTTKFLESQLETARQSLAEQEGKIRTFKASHVGELPTQLGSNLQILSGLQAQLQAESSALNTAKQQRVYMESLQSQYRALRGSTKTSGGAPIGLPAIDQELDRLKAQLADLSSRYTDQHPDVRKLKDQIARTEKTREQIVADLKTQAETPQPDDGEIRDAGDVAAAPLLQLQGQLKANQIEISNHEHAISDLKAKLTDYQARLNQEPVSEQQLADLTRGYDQSKANYDELLKKRNDSAMATSMELLQQGERFRILDPPSLPLKPDFPNRLKFCGIGLGVGLALGGVVVGALEMMDDRIYEEKALKELLPTDVMVEIPGVDDPALKQRQRNKIWFGWAAAGIVLVTVLAGSAVSYLRG
jgi:polysaccharide chain length determinant protein (PEP-CTERM system associated)